MVLQFDICKWCLICMIQQAYKYLSSSFWPCLMFCKLRDLKRVSCHENRIFYSPMCVFCRTISLPSFNGLRCKLVKIHCSSIYILGDKIGLSVWHHQSSHLQSVVYFICIFYPFLKLKCISGTNADICQRWTGFWFFQGILCDTPKKHRRTSRGGLQAPQLQIFLKLFVQNAIDSGKVLGRKHSERFSKPDLKATFSDVCLVKTGLFKIK